MEGGTDDAGLNLVRQGGLDVHFAARRFDADPIATAESRAKTT